MTEKVVNIKDISIINNRVLKVGSARFVIDKISSYELVEEYIPNDITYMALATNEGHCYFDIKHKKVLEKIMVDLDHIIAVKDFAKVKFNDIGGITIKS